MRTMQADERDQRYSLSDEELAELEELRHQRRMEVGRRALAACREMLAPKLREIEKTEECERVSRETCEDGHNFEDTELLATLQCSRCGIMVEHPKRTEKLIGRKNPI